MKDPFFNLYQVMKLIGKFLKKSVESVLLLRDDYWKDTSTVIIKLELDKPRSSKDLLHLLTRAINLPFDMEDVSKKDLLH